MVRGTNAKNEVEKKIIDLFGADYVGTIDKKIYIWADDSGERVQIAISMTCPKNFIDGTNNSQPISADGIGFDFENMPAPSNNTNLEFTQEEKETINELIAKLGL